MMILACLVLAWLIVAPDKGTLAFTRGTAGAVRGAVGTGRSSLTRKATPQDRSRRGRAPGRSQGARAQARYRDAGGQSGLTRRSVLAGWREGVATATARRDEGKDLWSRGSRIGGRVAGGTRNVVAGARTTLRTRRTSATAGPAATQTVVQDDLTRPVAPPAGQSPSPQPADTTGPAESGGATMRTCRRCGDDALIPEEGLVCDVCRDEARNPQGQYHLSADELAYARRGAVDDNRTDHQVRRDLEARYGSLMMYRLSIRAARSQTTCSRCGERDADQPDTFCTACRLAGWDAVRKIHDAWQQLGADQQPKPCSRCGHSRFLGPDGICGVCEYDLHYLPHGQQDTQPSDGTGPARDGQTLFTSSTDDLSAATRAGPAADVPADPADPAAPQGAAEGEGRYVVWSRQGAASYWVLDRRDVDSPMGPYPKQHATEIAGFFNAAVDADVVDTTAPSAASTSVAEPVADHPGTTPRKETGMAIAGTELANLDDVASEVKAASAEVEQLGVAFDALKGWANNLIDRWAGTSWSTAGLDASIAGVAEQAGALKGPDGVMEQLAEIEKEIAKARSVGEAAEAARAKGDLRGFIPS